jgi:hypothetical protein
VSWFTIIAFSLVLFLGVVFPLWPVRLALINDLDEIERIRLLIAATRSARTPAGLDRSFARQQTRYHTEAGTDDPVALKSSSSLAHSDPSAEKSIK